MNASELTHSFLDILLMYALELASSSLDSLLMYVMELEKILFIVCWCML